MHENEYAKQDIDLTLELVELSIEDLGIGSDDKKSEDEDILDADSLKVFEVDSGITELNTGLLDVLDLNVDLDSSELEGDQEGLSDNLDIDLGDLGSFGEDIFGVEDTQTLKVLSTEFNENVLRLYRKNVTEDLYAINDTIDKIKGNIQRKTEDFANSIFGGKSDTTSTNNKSMNFIRFLNKEGVVKTISTSKKFTESDFQDLFLKFIDETNIYGTFKMPKEKLNECTDYNDVKEVYHRLLSLVTSTKQASYKENADLTSLERVSSDMHLLSVAMTDHVSEFKPIIKVEKYNDESGYEQFRYYIAKDGTSEICVCEDEETFPYMIVTTTDSSELPVRYLLPKVLTYNLDGTEVKVLPPYRDYVDLKKKIKQFDTFGSYSKNQVVPSKLSARLMDSVDKLEMEVVQQETQMDNLNTLDKMRFEFTENKKDIIERFMERSKSYIAGTKQMLDEGTIRTALLKEKISKDYYDNLFNAVYADLASCGPIIEATDIYYKKVYYENLKAGLLKCQDVVNINNVGYHERFGEGVIAIIESASIFCSVLNKEELNLDGILDIKNIEILNRAIAECDSIIITQEVRIESLIASVIKNHNAMFRYGLPYHEGRSVDCSKCGVLRYLMPLEELKELISNIAVIYLDNVCKDIAFNKLLKRKVKLNINHINAICSVPRVTSDNSDHLENILKIILNKKADNKIYKQSLSDTLSFWNNTSSKELEKSLDFLKKASKAFREKHLPDFINACHEINVGVLRISNLFNTDIVNDIEVLVENIKRDWKPMNDLEKLKFYLDELGFKDADYEEYIGNQLGVGNKIKLDKFSYYIVKRECDIHGKPEVLSSYLYSMHKRKPMKEINGYDFFMDNIKYRVAFDSSIYNSVSSNMSKLKKVYLKDLMYKHLMSNGDGKSVITEIIPQLSVAPAILDSITPYENNYGFINCKTEVNGTSNVKPFLESDIDFCEYIKYKKYNYVFKDIYPILHADGLTCFCESSLNTIQYPSRRDLYEGYHKRILFDTEIGESEIDNCGFYVIGENKSNIFADLVEEVTESTADYYSEIVARMIFEIYQIDKSLATEVWNMCMSSAKSEQLVEYKMEDKLKNRLKGLALRYETNKEVGNL